VADIPAAAVSAGPLAMTPQIAAVAAVMDEIDQCRNPVPRDLCRRRMQSILDIGAAAERERLLAAFTAADSIIVGDWMREILGGPAVVRAGVSDHGCKRARPGCQGRGEYLPFYDGYVCQACVTADQRDVERGEVPWPAPGRMYRLAPGDLGRAAT
jgi:hypothetical protein